MKTTLLLIMLGITIIVPTSVMAETSVNECQIYYMYLYRDLNYNGIADGDHEGIRYGILGLIIYHANGDITTENILHNGWWEIQRELCVGDQVEFSFGGTCTPMRPLWFVDGENSEVKFILFLEKDDPLYLCQDYPETEYYPGVMFWPQVSTAN